jgi:glycosyltransferase involved in cell wall biosynthesis
MLSDGHVCEECNGHKYYNCFKKKCVKNSSLKSLINVIEMYFHLWRRYYDLIDLIIAPSTFYRKKLIKFGFPKEKIIHLPNFVNEELYSPSYNFNNYFIYFGRLSEEKGIFTLVESMRRVEKGKCLIIGSGAIQERIEALVKRMGLDNIELVGFKTGLELKKLIQNCMFSVLPSEWYENCPVALLESFVYGKPVIGSNAGGIPEHITHDKDGLIFKAADPEDLSDKINSLINAPNRILEMGKKARTKIEEVYSKKRHLEEILHLYSQLINYNSN